MSEIGMNIPINSLAGAAGPDPLPMLRAQFHKLRGAQAPSRGQIRKIAQDFESVLLHRLMQEMQNTVPESELFDSGAMKQIQGMFWQHLSQMMAEEGGMGLADQLYKDFCRAAGIDQTPPPGNRDLQKDGFVKIRSRNGKPLSLESVTSPKTDSAAGFMSLRKYRKQSSDVEPTPKPQMEFTR